MAFCMYADRKDERMPKKPGFKMNQMTRTVTVVTKKKGAIRSDVKTISVTIRSSHRLREADLDLFDRTFGTKSGDHLMHAHRRLERK